MPRNLDNAVHGIQESRTAIFLESGEAETHEQMDALKEIEELLNRAEVKIKEYDNK